MLKTYIYYSPSLKEVTAVVAENTLMAANLSQTAMSDGYYLATTCDVYLGAGAGFDVNAFDSVWTPKPEENREQEEKTGENLFYTGSTPLDDISFIDNSWKKIHIGLLDSYIRMVLRDTWKIKEKFVFVSFFNERIEIAIKTINGKAAILYFEVEINKELT